MSIKDSFIKASNKILVSQEIQKLYDEVESKEYLEEVVEDRDRYLPAIDFSTASNFARYGSAEKYYSDAIKNIYQNYPYDGSRKEKQQWRNNSSQLDLYVYDNIYPKTTGYLTLSSEFGGYNPSYVTFYGGPNSDLKDTIKESFKNSNLLDAEKSRESNLAINPNNRGNTVEFWLKAKPLFLSPSNVIFEVWNQTTDEQEVVRLTVLLTNNNYIKVAYIANGNSECNTTVSNLKIDDSIDVYSWNHYAVTFKNKDSDLLVELYINGKYHNNILVANGAISGEVNNSSLVGTIGAAQQNPRFGFNGSIDEFRFWKEARTAQQISRFWFTSIAGGTNTDDSNTELGVYFKFNEGIMDDASYDAKVLDYSGRVSNGTIINYQSASRSTSSAIDEYSLQNSLEWQETPDAIMYPFHPAVTNTIQEYALSGSEWDGLNNSSIYNSLPSWIIEESEKAEADELQNLVQIISSYFDTLHCQIESLPKIREVKYYNDNEKQLPFINNILSSHNFQNLEIFSDLSLLEEVLSRNETIEFDKSVSEIKNSIFQNIHNNLSYIYKSKGTEKSIRNLIRCFGVDDELIKINLYSDNSIYSFNNSYSLTSSYGGTTFEKKFADFNHITRFNAFVCGSPIDDSIDGKSRIAAPPGNSKYFVPITVQAEVIFPKKIEDSSDYVSNFTSVSLFGVHKGNNENTLEWGDDEFNFSVFAEKRDLDSKDVYFKISGSFKDSSLNEYPIELTSSWYTDVYENEKWNFAIRIRQQNYEFSNIVDNTLDNDYVLDFIGINSSFDTVDNFFIQSVVVPKQYMKNALKVHKRPYLGAHYQNFDTSYRLQSSDVKVSSLRFWYDFLSEEELKEHAIDVSSQGRKNPNWNFAPYDSNLSTLGISKAETLALNWDFSNVTSSDSVGEFFVDDRSNQKDVSESSLISILSGRYTGKGYNFPFNNTQVVNKEFLYSNKLQLPETITTSELVQIKETDSIYKPVNKPISYYYSIEKSMSQIINSEMLKWFSTIEAFNNIIGEPINRYKKEYTDLRALRDMFFDQVGNSPDFEKFLEFFKWIDSSISLMIQQLIPASSNISSNVRNIVESHMFERNKVQHNFPLVNTKQKIKTIPSFISNVDYNYAEQKVSSPKWMQGRVERNNPEITSGDAYADADREQIRRVKFSKTMNETPVGYDKISDTYYPMYHDKIKNFSGVYSFKTDKIDSKESAINTVNIENILRRSSFKFATDYVGNNNAIIARREERIGNFRNKYEYFQTSGRSANNLRLMDITGSLSVTSSFNFADEIVSRDLPVRPVIKTVIVERFAAPGGPEISSRGSLNAESEEYSVYNSINLRNGTVRKYLDKISAESSSIDFENPSYHKVNKNTNYKLINNEGDTKKEYDNSFISHQIPRSDAQYAWMTASLSKKPLFSGYFTEYNNIPEYDDTNIEFLSGANNTDFIGLNIQDGTLKTVDTASGVISPAEEYPDVNTYLLNINGPYQGSGWKQNVKQDNKIVIQSRKNNKILSQIQPSEVRYFDKNGNPKTNKQKRGEVFKEYREPPVEFNNPMLHKIHMDSSTDDIELYSSYDNNKDKFANPDLNDNLTIKQNKDPQVHDKLLKLQNSGYDQKPTILEVEKTQIIIPRKKIIGLKEVRTKPNYDDNGFTGSLLDEVTFWRDDEKNRERITGSVDIFKYADNKYSGIPDAEMLMYNKTSVKTTVSGIRSSKESIYALDNSSSIQSTGISNVTYNNPLKGALSKNTLSEEKYNILNNINYYMNSVVSYDKTLKNLYNIRGDINFLNFLYDKTGSAYPSKPLINTMVSASEGIYIGGSLQDRFGNINVVLWNGTDVQDINSNTFSTSKECKSLISCSSGVYASFSGIGTVQKFNGTSWSIAFSTPSNDGIYCLLSCSQGILAGGKANLSLYDGSSVKTIGNNLSGAPASTVKDIVSGSDGLYIATSTGVKKFIHALDNTAGLKQFETLYTGSVNKILSQSAGLISGHSVNATGYYPDTGGVKWYVGTTVRDLSTSNKLQGDVFSLLWDSPNLIYAGGSFVNDQTNQRLNGLAVFNVNGVDWQYIGRSAKRSGVVFESGESVNCLIPSNNKIIIGGTFNKIRSGPIIKNNKYGRRYTFEGYKHDQDISSSADIVMPHPQLVYNNFIPPLSGNIQIDDLIESQNYTHEYNTYTASAGLRVMNDGYIYDTDKISGKKPFFDSYDEYVKDIKPHTQKYSILPEFRISDYVKDYINKPSLFNSIVTSDYLKMDGGLQENGFSSVNDINITDNLNFNLVSDLTQDNEELEFNIKISGLKKFLPKRDFYPSERIVTLSSYFINSFLNLNDDITSSFNPEDKFSSTLSNNTPINGQILTLLQPLFSPGILLNTVKSSIAVDWPVYIGAYGKYDQSTVPQFYSSSYSEKITQTVTDEIGSLKTTSSYLAPGYLNIDPTFRMPFEGLLEFDTIIPDNLRKNENNLYYLNPSHYTSDILTGKDYDEIVYPSYAMTPSGSISGFGFRDSNYKLAMHNFLAEIPNLFLKDNLTKFVSENTTVSAVSGKQYTMLVVLKKHSKYNSFIASTFYDNRKDMESWLKETLILPSTDFMYGPPSKFWTSVDEAAVNSLFSKSPYNLYFKFIDTPAYAPYVPPYFYGTSVAKITFTPPETKQYSIKDVIELSMIEYYNEGADEVFKRICTILDPESSNWKTSPSYKNMMCVSSSINLKGTKPYLDTQFSSDGQLNTAADSGQNLWVIQTKFETPSINFTDVESYSSNLGMKFIGGTKVGESISGIFSNVFQGIWTTYGKPATENDGITVTLTDIDSETSLARLCGFQLGTKQIGAVGNNKVISEGVVIIPFTNIKNHGKNKSTKYAETVMAPRGERPTDLTSLPSDSAPYYFKIDRKVIENVLGGLPFQKRARTKYEDIKNRIFDGSVDKNNSIIKLMQAMTKYVIPPHLDWLRNRDIDPFVMYISEFDVTLDSEDLSDIWQGLMPKCSTKVEEQEYIINHKLLPNELFHGKKINPGTAFKIFKVKQLAKINYYDLTEDSKDDSKFKFKFNNTNIAEAPKYSYNWPYDFCSVVEFVNVEAGVSLKKKS